jgi:isopentenyl-diphosphate delta-isomerase
MDELLILVDRHARKKDIATKLQAHQQGHLQRALSVFIFDPDGRLLLQQRALGKYHSAGLWSNTCCGHPRPGERALAASKRRLHEKMGIRCPLHKVFTLLYREPVSNQLIEHEYGHVYAGIWQGNPVPNPEEANDWQWQPLSGLAARIDAAPQTFTIWFRRVVETCGLTGLSAWKEQALAGPGTVVLPKASA